MKRALTQVFTKTHENPVCELHLTFNKQLFKHE